jgi:hypothetical protein
MVRYPSPLVSRPIFGALTGRRYALVSLTYRRPRSKARRNAVLLAARRTRHDTPPLPSWHSADSVVSYHSAQVPLPRGRPARPVAARRLVCRQDLIAWARHERRGAAERGAAGGGGRGTRGAL